MVSLPFPVGIRKGKFFTRMFMTGCSVLAWLDSNHWLRRSRPTHVSREKWGTKNLLKYMDGTLIHRLHEHLNQLRNLTNPSLAPFESCFSCLRDCESAGAVQSSSSEAENITIHSGGQFLHQYSFQVFVLYLYFRLFYFGKCLLHTLCFLHHI